jgi:cyclomaltodextrinase
MSNNLSAPKWVADSVFYQIFPERFANGDPGNDPHGVVPWGSKPTREDFMGGDLQGILDRLPYLQDVGVTAIYLTPIFEARTNHKYDTCDYMKIDPSFGDAELLRKVVDGAHERGIRIILDAVFNHCGDGFWAFEDLKERGASSNYAPWFIVDSYPIHQNPPNYQTYGVTWYLPKLDTGNPEVREYLLKVATYWMEACDIDGWRLDVPWKIPIDFWREFRERVKRIKPDAYIVGEIWRDPSPWLRGDTFDGVMNYPLRQHILDFCVYENMDAEDFNFEIGHLRDVHGHSAPYQLNLLGSHDTARILTLCDEDVDRAIMAIAFIFTYVGAPMIFYGDEVGLTGEDDPDCRKSMIWDETRWRPRLVDAYRALIRARNEHKAMRSGDFEPLYIFNGVYAYQCTHEEDKVIVVLNPREKRQRVKIPLPVRTLEQRTWVDAISGTQFFEREGHIQINDLPSKKAYVLVSE